MKLWVAYDNRDRGVKGEYKINKLKVNLSVRYTFVSRKIANYETVMAMLFLSTEKIN